MPVDNSNKSLTSFSYNSRIYLSMLLVVVVALGMYFGYGYISYLNSNKDVAGASLSSGVEIQSIPGIAESSSEYADLQSTQNTENANIAMRTGGSSVPTIVRGGSANLKDFNAAELAEKNKNLCDLKELKKAKEAGVKAFELRCRGCTAAQLLAAGYTPSELKAAGFSAKSLLAAGVSLAELRAAGFRGSALLSSQVDACALASSGKNAAELKADGYTAK